MNQHVEQLLLPLKIDQSARFDNFYTDDLFVINSLKNTALNRSDSFVLLHGQTNTGKTHLLQALLSLLQSHSISVQYFYAEMLLDAPPEIVSFDTQTVILIDDIHLLAQNMQWERKLYDLYNEAYRQKKLLVCSRTAVKTISFDLQDLESRINSGLQLKLKDNDENQLKNIIKLRAQCLGLLFDQGVLDYLLTHFSRDLDVQMSIMQELNKQSLQSSRKVTIPFVKSCQFAF